MHWYGDHMSGWGYGFMTLSMVLFWGLVVTGVVLLVRYLGRDQRPPSEPAGAAAERLLAERFAPDAPAAPGQALAEILAAEQALAREPRTGTSAAPPIAGGDEHQTARRHHALPRDFRLRVTATAGSDR